MSNYDVIVVGGGVVGLSLVNYLGQNNIRVAFVERALPTFLSPDIRVSAINKTTQQFFETLNLWPMSAAPYEKVLVWSEGGEQALSFDSKELGEKNLGYIIENSVMQKTLWNVSLADYFCPAECDHLIEEKEQCVLRLKDGRVLQGQLIVGADGAHSWVRTQLAVGQWGRDYQQKAIVATVKTEYPHEATARQRFLKTGPLAFLPLQEKRLCSIVWTNPLQRTEALLEMNSKTFNQALEKALESCLGRLETIEPRLAFPLSLWHANQYVGPRVALIGDAAHTIHPLAGLGLNLGIRDAMCLGKVLISARRENQDLGSYSLLRRYERARKSANVGTSIFIEGVKWLFGKNSPRFLQQLGLKVCSELPLLKRLFARNALEV